MTILFFRSARNNQPGRGCLDLAPCQDSLNSVRWLLRRSENVSANQRPRRPSFFRSAPKHEHGRGRWDLSSCQISMNSVQRFKKRSRKCLSQSEARAAIVYFGSKNTNLVEDVEILLPVNFRWISLVGDRGEIENVSTNQRRGRQSSFSDRPENTNLVEHV